MSFFCVWQSKVLRHLFWERTPSRKGCSESASVAGRAETGQSDYFVVRLWTDLTCLWGALGCWLLCCPRLTQGLTEASTSSELQASLSSLLAQMMGALYHSFWCHLCLYQLATHQLPSYNDLISLIVPKLLVPGLELSFSHTWHGQRRVGRAPQSHPALNLTDTKVLSHPLLILHTRIQHCLPLCRPHLCLLWTLVKITSSSYVFLHSSEGQSPTTCEWLCFVIHKGSINTMYDVKRGWKDGEILFGKKIHDN